MRKSYNQDWSDCFCLDEESLSGLARIKNGYGKNIKKYDVGTRVFKQNGNKDSWRLKFKGKDYYIHRIIWVLTYGSIDPNLVIDHLDGDPFNNKIENLSLKTFANNARNNHKRSDNTTGNTGVSITETKAGNRYYDAYWNELNGAFKRKLFSIAKLGEETAKSLAIDYRAEQLQRLILEGADYTERHGT